MNVTDNESAVTTFSDEELVKALQVVERYMPNVADFCNQVNNAATVVTAVAYALTAIFHQQPAMFGDFLGLLDGFAPIYAGLAERFAAHYPEQYGQLIQAGQMVVLTPSLAEDLPSMDNSKLN